MFFLNQEINPANIKSRIKKQTHNKRTWTLNQKKKKKKHEDHQIKKHEQKQTQENEDWH